MLDTYTSFCPFMSLQPLDNMRAIGLPFCNNEKNAPVYSRLVLILPFFLSEPLFPAPLQSSCGALRAAPILLLPPLPIILHPHGDTHGPHYGLHVPSPMCRARLLKPRVYMCRPYPKRNCIVHSPRRCECCGHPAAQKSASLQWLSS